MRYRTILFDLDGTLLDASPDLHAAINRTRRDFGFEPVSLASVRAALGDGARKLVERCVEGVVLEEALARFRTHYAACLTENTRLYPGILELLEALLDAGARLALVTNKPQRFTEPIADHFGLRRFFPVVVGGSERRALKPEPAMLQFALEALGAGSDGALMVGDGEQDVKAARAAGVAACGVLYGIGSPARLRALTPEHLAEDPVAIGEVVFRGGR